MADTVVWGMHGGRSGDADTLFLTKGFVAIGWDDAGDLSKMGDRHPARNSRKARFTRLAQP
jgi:restriction system protein